MPSYWNAVGLTGARQLLIASPRDIQSRSFTYGDGNNLSGAKGQTSSDALYSKSVLRQIQWPTPLEEDYAQNEIDEDDYSCSPIEVEEERAGSESSASSDTESSSSESVVYPEPQQPLEDTFTQSGEDPTQLIEAQSDIIVNLPTSGQGPRDAPRAYNNTGLIESPEVLTIINYPDDAVVSDTTYLRLPGMRSRLEITRVTWVREIPVQPSRLPDELAHQVSSAAVHTAIHIPQHSPPSRIRAVSNPILSPFQSPLRETSVSGTNLIHAPTLSSPHEHHPTMPPGKPHDSSSPLNSVPSYAFLTDQDSPLPHEFSSIDNFHEAVTRPVKQFATQSQPVSPIHTPASSMAGPSKVLLDILNGTSADALLHNIPVPRAGVADPGFVSPHDPPVFKPKPIGSLSFSLPVGRRRLSDSTSGDGFPLAAAPAEDIELVLPWPPVLSP